MIPSARNTTEPNEASRRTLLLAIAVLGLAFFFTEHDLGKSRLESFASTAEEMGDSVQTGDSRRQLGFSLIGALGLFFLLRRDVTARGKGDSHLLCDDQRFASVPAEGPCRQKVAVTFSAGPCSLRNPSTPLNGLVGFDRQHPQHHRPTSRQGRIFGTIGATGFLGRGPRSVAKQSILAQ